MFKNSSRLGLSTKCFIFHFKPIMVACRCSGKLYKMSQMMWCLCDFTVKKTLKCSRLKLHNNWLRKIHHLTVKWSVLTIASIDDYYKSIPLLQTPMTRTYVKSFLYRVHLLWSNNMIMRNHADFLVPNILKCTSTCNIKNAWTKYMEDKTSVFCTKSNLKWH